MMNFPDQAFLLEIGLIEAELLDLSGGYVFEDRGQSSGGANIRCYGSGTASGVFGGADGSYKITVGYINEEDGVSSWSLQVNGETVSSWKGNGGTFALETRSVTLDLDEGDTIALVGQRGGGEFARVDWLEIEPASGGIGLGRTEAEDLALSGGYVFEDSDESSGGANIRCYGNGTASGVFDGPDGSYEVTVGYINEEDGVSSWSLQVNGETVSSWDGNGGTFSLETRSVTVDLDEGDTIALVGQRGGGEFARVDWLEIEPASEGIGLGRIEAEDLALSGGYVFEDRDESSGGANIRCYGNGTASGVFDGPDGSYEVTVGYINEEDGVSSWSLQVNGETVSSWNGNGGTFALETRSLTVDLDEGDTIALVGQRDGGEFARVDWLEIEPADEEPPAPPMPPVNPFSPADHDLFAFIGQSNANGHFFRRSGDTSGGALGNDVFEAELVSRLGGSATAVNASTSGSGSNEHADPRSYWWDLGEDRPGPALNEAMRDIKAAERSGRDVDALIWAQGEDDARTISDDFANLDITVERLKTATTKVFEYIRDALDDPDLPIFVQELGAFPEDGGWLDGPYGALGAIREAQNQLIAEMDNVFLGAETTDVSQHQDTIHFNNAGYGIIAERLARTVAESFDEGWIV